MATKQYPDLLANGDSLGSSEFIASDGVQRKVVAQIKAVVDGTPVPGVAAPAKFQFFTANSSGTMTNRMELRADGTITGVPCVLAQSAVAVSGAADTNENILGTITVPAGAIGPNGSIRVTAAFSYTNSANTKTLRVRFGGIGGTIYYSNAPTTSASNSVLVTIMNRNAANSQTSLIAAAAVGWNAATGNALVTSSVDTSAATTIVLTGTKALGSETLTLEGYIVELLYGA